MATSVSGLRRPLSYGHVFAVRIHFFDMHAQFFTRQGIFAHQSKEFKNERGE